MLTWGLFPGSTDFVDGKKSPGEISELVGWTFDEVNWEETTLLDSGVAIGVTVVGVIMEIVEEKMMSDDGTTLLEAGVPMEFVGLIVEMVEEEMVTNDRTTLLEAGVPIEVVGVIMEIIEVEIVTDDGMWNNCTDAVVVLCRP